MIKYLKTIKIIRENQEGKVNYSKYILK